MDLMVLGPQFSPEVERAHPYQPLAQYNETPPPPPPLGTKNEVLDQAGQQNRWLFILNSIAILIHFIMFCISLDRWINLRVKPEYLLKRDSLLVVGRPIPNSTLDRAVRGFMPEKNDIARNPSPPAPVLQLQSHLTGERWAYWDRESDIVQGKRSVCRDWRTASSNLGITVMFPEGSSCTRENATAIIKEGTNLFDRSCLPLLGNTSWKNANTTTLLGLNDTDTTIQDQCSVAKPTTLSFISNSTYNLTVEMWNYPRDSGGKIDIGVCTLMFFLLSATFQLFTFLATPYSYLFDDARYTDAAQHRWLAAGDRAAILRELRFNWLRFIEYTFSGSLVLITVAVISGIVDQDLIACMFGLSAVCMLCGLVAEICLRLANVLPCMARQLPGQVSKDALSGTLQDIIFDTQNLNSIDPHTDRMKKTLDDLSGEIYRLLANSPSINALSGTIRSLKNDLTNIQADANSLRQSIHQKAYSTQLAVDRTFDNIDHANESLQLLPLCRNWVALASFLSHAIGWICIAFPLYLIRDKYSSWWNPCNAETLRLNFQLWRVIKDVTGMPTPIGDPGDDMFVPPDFVQVRFRNISPVISHCEPYHPLLYNFIIHRNNHPR